MWYDEFLGQDIVGMVLAGAILLRGPTNCGVHGWPVRATDTGPWIERSGMRDGIKSLDERKLMEAHDENRKFDSGAVRDGGKKPALHLISPHAMNRLGEWLRFACEDRQPKPYSKRNWEKGLPFSETVASVQRHIEKFKLGDQSEDHIAAILFGGMALAHFEEEIKAGRLPASLDDMPHYATSKPGDTRINPATGQRERYMRSYGTLPQRGLITQSDIVDGRVIRDVREDEEVSVVPEELRKLPTGQIDYYAAHMDRERDHALRVKPFTVYLCGPITGQHIDSKWRRVAESYLGPAIKVLDPMRGKDPCKIENQGMSYMGQLAAPEIASRDSDDIKEADVIFAHFPYEPPRQSIGSLMEMGMASALGKTILLCTKVKVFSEHLFCRNFTTLEPDFDQALRRIEAMAKAKQR